MEINYSTAIITFSESIERLNGIFDDAQAWGVVTIKEWIDCYEGSRFTQIGEHTAVITSEYNMTFILEWFSKYTTITSIQEE